MTQVFRAPRKYVQGKGTLWEISAYTAELGDRALCLISSEVFKRVEKPLMGSFRNSDVKVIYEHFNRECTHGEIRRISRMVKDNSINVIIGIGGGKTHDTAKAVGHLMKIPAVIVPTVASTDGPCTALAAIHSENGAFEEYLRLKDNPAVVILDTEIIAQSPTRLLVAGMGDALSTYFEARACEAANAATYAEGESSMTALELARFCYRTVLEEGYTAKLAAETDIPSRSLEKIVEANVLLSGIAFESAGIAAAHAISNGLTRLPELRDTYHGEMVAFGTLVQLVLENAPAREIDEVRVFCHRVGLPVTLAELGITEVTEEKIRKVCEAATLPEESIHNMPFKVTADDVYAAIMVADALGREHRQYV